MEPFFGKVNLVELSMKHAYLIMAHARLDHLQILISALDDIRNDLFIHIDKKSAIICPKLKVQTSKLYIVSNPLDARWGDVSLVEVELLLIGEMLKNGRYDYCHFLSDSDFPIKSQDYIHEKCNRYNGKQFIGFSSSADAEISNKMRYYYLFSKHFKDANVFQRGLRYLFLCLQHFVHLRRNQELILKKGCQWCSITYDLAEYLFTRKDEILKIFKHTYCPDEIFIQTLCWNSPFKESIYNVDDEFRGCLRFIKWQDNIICPIVGEDIDLMIASDYWFARKFTEGQEELVVEIKKRWGENV